MKTPDDEIGTTSDISPGRVLAVRAGVTSLVAGLLMFLSTFVIFAVNFGKFDHFEEHGRTTFLLAIGGMALMIVGMVALAAGGSGLAGALWHLDPNRAQKMLRPWARLSGRLTDEAFSEMKTVRQSLAGFTDAADVPTERIVQVRCRACRALNDETDKFCGQCGAAL